MKLITVSSANEWSKLREIVVGSATGANWPSSDPVFSKEHEKTTWRDSPPPSGPVPNWIIDETNEDLEGLVDILESANVVVHRPTDWDFVTNRGMYNYCPRDRLLVAGDTVVDVPMMYPCRRQEILSLEFLVSHDIKYVTMPIDRGLVLDAANVSRLGQSWIFLESVSGNRAAYHWLCDAFPHITVEICNFYSGVHIDSTVVPLREGLVMLNASRVTEETLPRCLKNWDKIWVDDLVPQKFYQYPYASKWIGMNVLSLDQNTVIMDAAQTGLRLKLEQQGFTVIPHQLRHSRTLGGGFHCVTLDLWRQDD